MYLCDYVNNYAAAVVVSYKVYAARCFRMTFQVWLGTSTDLNFSRYTMHMDWQYCLKQMYLLGFRIFFLSDLQVLICSKTHTVMGSYCRYNSFKDQHRFMTFLGYCYHHRKKLILHQSFCLSICARVIALCSVCNISLRWR